MERTEIYSPQPTPLGGPSRPMLHATVLSPSAANAPLPTLTPLRRDSGVGGLTRNNFRWKSEGGRKGKCHRATRTGRGAGRTPTAPAVTEPGEPSREGDEEGMELLPAPPHLRNPGASGCVRFSFWYHQP